MDLNGVGFLGAIIIGGLAGWLAEKFMRSDMGLIMNIILGIVGAIVLNFILAAIFHVGYTGWLAYLLIGFIGACLLIAVARVVRR
ncbi:GlsB/YeaQ/YmgE family stress response membrane protein [Rhizobium halophytocola]|uniref:Membrane protein YeaQ/YmgE (Transglycosylase-associated protein family) n=1 Tax=Rhizobium halophytocola TaxID=735519 RepID=A0ABS4DWG9_9HYPH|nr:GlsB/YeaQ/YmgE family stress response membrane protein [Rhizobium halophytocola]MBP1850031.1 putative membrane protein YeaQ/YmgE (transglycosylase-associated protein family) [Rhizobium halophytocola]